ncbi:MAG TPA: molybdopterin-dependent oxidoreductase [Blastocatellia bacterium]|nr:molybdopterin-dependent oxidoreductase [Blastocatellia bacterium]
MALFDSLQKLNESRRGTSRRMFMFSGAGLVVSYFGWRWWRDRARPVVQRKTKFVTPNNEFYFTEIDSGFAPQVGKDKWQLKVSGCSGKSFSLSYDELLKLERRKIYKTFACVGNEVGGPAIGNAEWTVTPLAPLVMRVLGDRRDNVRVVCYAMDGFYSSVPLDVALSDQAFIAYEMNGVEIPKRHGWPARVLLPGIYGMKQPRWLERIEVTDKSVSGYWEKRGWCDECKVNLTARIDSAIRQDNGSWLVTGIAYCGARAVGTVEISADEGRTWQQAKITSERLPNAWATWELEWKPVKTGENLLTARVTDAAGGKQIEDNSGSFPSGATGLHRVTLQV